MNKLQLVIPLFLKLLPGFGVFVVLIYTVVCLLLFFQQTRFIFFPSSDIQTTPEFLNLDYQEVWLPVAADSGKVEQIYGWWIPSEPDTKVLLYLHGNGINIGANVEHASRFHQLGFSVLLIDYRGYGRSEGSFPTEAQVYQDATAAWKYLVNKQYQPHQIVLYGHSLGGAIAKRSPQGGIAIDLAVKHPDAAGLIVESSFTSIGEMVDYQGKFWMLPVNLILNQRFDSLSKVRGLQMPVLFIHGTADWQVPDVMSQRLYTAAPEPKQLLLVPGAGHNDVAEVAGFQYLQTVQSFVEQVQTRQAKHICQENGKMPFQEEGYR